MGFKGKKYLEDVHIQTHTEKFFNCHICARQLQSVEALKQHLLWHAEAARVKTSPAKDQELQPMLVLPQITVPDEKHHCWPCRRVFKNEEDLAKHKVVHNYSAKVMNETDRRLSCKLCTSKLESEIWLAQHYTTKHNILFGLRYQCNLCFVSFPTPKDRTMHTCVNHSESVEWKLL